MLGRRRSVARAVCVEVGLSRRADFMQKGQKFSAQAARFGATFSFTR
jgi:hypothetical protein